MRFRQLLVAKKKTVNLRILSTIFLLLLAACSTTQPEAQEVIVVQDNPTLPDGCSPAEVAQLIMGFLDAYNNDDQEQLIRFFPRTFEWYSDSFKVDGVEGDEEHHFVTRPGRRDALLNYVAERQQHGDRLQLVAVDVAGPSWHGGADFSFTLTREADDVRRGPEGRDRYVVGGGAIRCEAQKFWAWGMGTAPPDTPKSDLGQGCPDPPPGSPENAAIACARPVLEEGEG